MILSDFFITRPRFAIVVSIVMVLLGLMAIVVLPVSQYPQITPPQIVVQASYPGASADVVVDTVAVPIENELNGVEGMLYMESTSDDSGDYQLTITFDIGTDPDIAQVKVENRLQQVNPFLPEIVRQEGLSVTTQMANILGMLVLRSPNQTHSSLFLSNYAYANIQNPLARIKGVSAVNIYGPQYSMRIWINPEKLSALGLSSDDVVKAVKTQNIQASIGSIGSAPNNEQTGVVLSLTAKGLLKTPEDFDNIILKTNAQGGLIRLKDVAKTELGANTYNLSATYDNAPAVVIGLSQTPGSNSLSIMENIKKEIETLSDAFPEDMEFKIAYDSTTFVRASIESIISTLFITFLLVVGVVFLFLQNPKTTLIPAITIPVSLIATFAVLFMIGFDINILTLFAMILAIGLVVDDAIVVVERTEYLIEKEQLDSVLASKKAMNQISGAVIATTFVLLSIFIPVALMPGITGQIYAQFALTIATAVCFSSINALTLSPSLCAIFLKKKKEIHPLFSKFDKGLDKTKEFYVRLVTFLSSRLLLTTLLTLGTLILTIGIAYLTPTSFVPEEDQGVILSNVQLSETAGINQTKQVLSNVGNKILSQKGVAYSLGVAGHSLLGGAGENIGMSIVGLTPWDERKNLSAQEMIKNLNKQFANDNEASINFFSLPAIPGVGTSSGLSFNLLSLDNSASSEVLDSALDTFLINLNKTPEISYAFSTYTPSMPHIFLDVDRTKLESYQIPVASLFQTLENNLGSTYINNITLDGQVNKVILQADASYRMTKEDILNTYVQTNTGKQMQVQSFADLKTTMLPKIITRFNQYNSAPVIAEASENTSTGTALDTVENLTKKVLSNQFSIAWTGLSLQELEAQGLAFILMTLAVIFSYLFLVALYESWMIALSVMFSTVFAVLGAFVGLFLLNLPLSIYAQLGLVMLIGLAAKNAILIADFALDYRKQGTPILQAVQQAAQERYRAVLMTALTFILGVFPMVIATGAGAASQRAIGTAVFFGMIFATLIGVVFIPALFAVFDTISSKRKEEQR
ncbi:MAG: efflux RND transporter permease subunit [Alphaproteobacteria bacterium]|nr:efflux RND transporter permease subunit [Alphaproteobacteria bacterium]